MKQKSSKSLLHWLDNNILLILTGLLLAFIPLYPKLPLFDIIPGYIVRVRIEDFLVTFSVIVFLVQLLRKKVSIKTPLTTIILLYALFGFLSTISGIYLTKTIPTDQIHVVKSFLHYLRYLEYFTLFFIVQAAVQTKRDLKILLSIIFVTLAAVGFYGLGQKYLYWPVYSTMNREFSKGVRLYLTEHARVQSTFGGHYDMAGYLVILMPFVILFSFITKKKLIKATLWLLFALSIWLLVLSSARTSFVAALAGIYLAIFLASMIEKTWKERATKLLYRSLGSALIILVIFNAFGESITERMLQSLEAYPQVTLIFDGISDARKYVVTQLESNSDIKFVIDIETPENGISTDQAEVLIASDTTPSPIKPSDVYVDVPDKVKVATISATGEKIFIIIEVPRTYSDNAIKHGLSLAIRLDTLWPQALNGFYTNPVLGTGYATLTKATVEEFTEAESTDNNFLRVLGEIGLLGFVTFFGTIIIALYQAFKMLFDKKSNDLYKKMFAAAYIGGSVGLLLNAVFIDVYAASKVAFTFWAITGILIALINIKDVYKPAKIKQTKKKRRRKGKFANTPKKKAKTRP